MRAPWRRYGMPFVSRIGRRCTGSLAICAPRQPVPANTPEETRLAWKRRGRIKQAICLAWGSIGQSDERVLEVLHRCATDTGEDAAVRAAASKALGQVGSTSSRPSLERAAQDQEWCTRTEARQALIGGRVPRAERDRPAGLL